MKLIKHINPTIKISIVAFNMLLTAICKCFYEMIMVLFCMCIITLSHAQPYRINVATTSTAPAIPDIAQYIASGRVMSIFTYNLPGNSPPVRVYGKIERISPSPFAITTLPSFTSQVGFTMAFNQPIVLPPTLQRDVFGAFSDKNIQGTNIDLSTIRDANNNIILPDGNYRICYYARHRDSTSVNVSDPNLGCGFFTISCQPANSVLINTVVKPLVNPVIAQTIATGGVISNLQLSSPLTCGNALRLYGKIERISPSPSFTITTSSDNRLNQPFTPQTATSITPAMQAQAFGNFAESNLIVTGIDPALIKDARNNFKLPDGNYRICYYTRYVGSGGELGGNASNPNLGCGNFSICNSAGVAPQFTQPVNNLTATSSMGLVKPASPVIFTWIPPQASCGISAGAFTYDFEIREIYNNQTLIDALNNPYVFRKTLLPSTTFLLDTNLNRNVLQVGKKYAIRVRALSANLNQPVDIDNNGYSRVEGFQYGESAAPTVPKFNVSFIPFVERRSDFWDKKLTDYENNKRGDTLVPLNQYVPLVLTKNNIVYSPDAIELFLVLNPELTEMDKVKLSYAPKIPDLAAVPIKDARNFVTEHAMNLTPDVVEENRFKKYLDSLNLYVRTQKTNVQGSELVELVKHLNTFSRQVRTTDRVSMNLINTLLSELLYELKANLALLNRKDFNQLKSVIANIEELLISMAEVTSFLNTYEDQILSYNTIKQPVGYSHADTVNSDYLPALMDPLLPFNVILCRYTKTQPSTPILTSPDLMGTYKVYYVLSTLYNHKNPEINAKSTNTPASTAQVSLPKTTFKLWAENILNRTKTKEQDIDFLDAFLRSRNRWPYPKHFTIIIKAE